ncbi:MAG: Asp-tRNA(Asn)/Glu-tRNA(Gln) amidotransferase subunit GatB [Nanoarchaeota archaeon]
MNEKELSGMNGLGGMIGLEMHCYLTTKEKLFCECIASREKGLRGNVNICPICCGMPGAKPMLPNGNAVEKAVMIALMLGCKVNLSMPWQRKHYNWPDLPKGYQNTLSGPGAIPVGEKGNFLGIGITEMHLEEDPASWNPDSGEVDYNRSGLPLVEIVTEPEFKNAEEVMGWLNELTHALAYLKAVDSNAGIKVDVNVSLQPLPGSRSPGTQRVEIKNISSIENIGKAIYYELERQSKEGSKRETRRYDEAKNKTILMRSKENAEDYRFIRDPDLEDINLNNGFVAEMGNRLPEMPKVKLEKLIKKHKIDKSSAEILSKNIDIVEFFEKVIEKVEAKLAVPWVTVELMRFLNYNKKLLHEVDLKVEHFVELLKLIEEGKITPLKGKEILKSWHPKSSMPSVAGEGKISDEKELMKVIEKVISENRKAVEDYGKGEMNSFNFLLGAIMKATNKRADFAIARKLLEKRLK